MAKTTWSAVFIPVVAGQGLFLRDKKPCAPAQGARAAALEGFFCAHAIHPHPSALAVSGRMPPRAGRKSAANRAPTKAETVAQIADKTDLTKAQVNSVMAAMAETVEENLKKHKAALIPGLVKVTVAHKAATKAREGPHPITREPMVFRAKPARDVVKVRALKGLKDAI